jgi:hypothetical protein
LEYAGELTFYALARTTLVNGGAAVAILAYLGNVVGKGATAPDLRMPMAAFLVGLAACGLAMFFAYLTRLQLLNESARPAIVAIEHPWYLRLAMVFVLASLIAFSLGSWQAVVAFR